MYQDEQGTGSKSLDEIRQARREMYLRDLERREAIKMQAAARGYLIRKKLNPPLTPVSEEKSSKEQERKSSKIKVPTRMQKDDGRQTKAVKFNAGAASETFDRSSYLRERLQRDEEERKTKTIADIREERQAIYLRDLQRREATKLQAAARGYLARKYHPGLAKKREPPAKRNVQGTASVQSSRKISGQQNAKHEKPASSWGLMKRLLFGKTNEAPPEPEPSYEEQEFERFDPYADTEDFFGFADANYRERTGFFMSTLGRSERHIINPQSVTDEARNWKGRGEPKVSSDFDNGAYLRERRARAELESRSMAIAQRNAEKREVAQQDSENREATQTQKQTKSSSSSKKKEKKKKKNKKKKSRTDKKKDKAKAKGEGSGKGKEPHGDASKLTTTTKKEKQAKGSSLIPVKKEESTALRTTPTNKPSIRKTPDPEFKQVKLRTIHKNVEGEEIMIEHESSSEVIFEEIIEEDIVPLDATENRTKEPMKPEIEAKGTAPLVLLDYKKETPIHSGSTYSTDIGDSWWLPSLNTEDTRAYRTEVYVPETRSYKTYPRPAPKNSTTEYWEAVRETYLPTVLGIYDDGESIDHSLLPSVGRSSQSHNSKDQDFDETSTVVADDDESWLPPGADSVISRAIQEGDSITSRAIPDGSAVDLADDSWVPSPSKPKGRSLQVDFAGAVNKQSSFSWAPHLPSPSKRDVSRVEQILTGDLEAPPFSDQPIPKLNSSSRDLEVGSHEDNNTALISETAPKTHRGKVLVIFMAIILILGGGAAAAYFLWEDAPWKT